MKRKPVVALSLAGLFSAVSWTVCAESAEDAIGEALDVTMLPKCGTHLKDALFTRAYEADKRIDAEWAACADAEAIRVRQRTIRSAILDSMGGLPERTPLNARTVKRIPRDGYVIEKVIFESMPGFFVTADLFLPDAAKFPYPCPGAIQPCGHSDTGRLMNGYHRAGIIGAQHGLVTLVYDPICQGERHQRLHRAAFNAVDEHNAIGIRSVLLGWNAARFRIFDGMRALDYLASRPEVDASKLGVTGMSGGGTLTSYLMSLDDRVRAAAPNGYITSIQRLFRGHPQDAEQNFFGMHAFGLNHTSWCVLRAPSPVLLGLSEGDGFAYDGSMDTYAAAMPVFGRFGAEKNFRYVRTQGDHGWYESTKQASYDWLAHHLRGEPREWRHDEHANRALDLGFSLEPHDDAMDGEAGEFAAPDGTVLKLKGNRTAYDILRAEAAAAEAKRPALTPELVRRVARIDAAEEIAFREKTVAPVALDGHVKLVRKVLMRDDDFTMLPVSCFLPEEVKADPVILVSDAPRRRTNAAVVRRFLAEGRAVAVVDLRGFCETGTAGCRFYFCPDCDEDLAVRHYCFGENLVAKRAEDLVVAARALGREFGGRTPVIHAEGRAVIPAAHAFFCFRGRFGGFRTDREPRSWRSMVFDTYAPVRFANVVQDAYRHYDWMDLVREEMGTETRAIQSEIDRIAANGGGTVEVAPGRHRVGSLFLKDNVELRLAKDAVLEGSNDGRDYPGIRLECSEMPAPWQAVVWAVGATNVAITGEGEVFGNGGAFAFGCPTNRPRGIVFLRCSQVRCEGFRLRDTASWGCYFKECDGVTAKGLRIFNHANTNNDGLDIEARNVLVEDCDIDAGDDGICLKSDNPGFTVENVLVTNCTVRSCCSALKFGTASHGTARNIRFADCRVRECRAGLTLPWDGEDHYLVRHAAEYPGSRRGFYCGAALQVDCVDGGTVEDFVFDGIDVEACLVPVFVCGGERRNRSFAGLPTGLPFGSARRLADIVIRNLKAKAMSPTASAITGTALCRPQNITLENVEVECMSAGYAASGAAKDATVPEKEGSYPDPWMFDHSILPAWGLYARHVDGLTLRNVDFRLEPNDFTDNSRVELRKRIVRDDVKGSE